MKPVYSSTPQTQTPLASQGAAHASTVHIMPFRVLLAVFLTLLVLTYVTVAVRYVNLGSLNIWIALAIATVKGALVVLYFMHLRYDSPFHSIVFVTALVFMLLFLGITILDTIEYQPAIDAVTGMP